MSGYVLDTEYDPLDERRGPNYDREAMLFDYDPLLEPVPRPRQIGPIYYDDD